MKRLYPEISPFAVHQIDVGAGYTLYVEQCGDPQGVPVVFLHGGPGSGCKPYHRQFFDPARYHVVIFDQRGCNRSRPQGEVAKNTTQDLVADMELIRERLDIERWVLFGGSWGATLALVYAQTHPERVLAINVRGTFLARPRDIDWFVRGGVNRIFPDYWDEFVDHIPVAERGDLVRAYHRRVHGDNAVAREAAARTWSRWAGRVVTYLLSAQEQSGEPEDLDKMCNEVSIETHYAHNHYFLTPNQILDNVHKLPDVPTVIIHGRRDLTCTAEASWQLHRVLPKSKLVILPESGHLAGEPGMIDALVSATDEMLGRL
ncbi:MAG: prolyl aminopeptidase [Gammaproteobacteria bacterium]